MKTYIILLRGVMPSGRNKVLMAPLRAALEEAGLAGVQTYIQSGNVVAASALGQAELETLVHVAIERTFGGDIRVLARTLAQFRTILSRNPFDDGDAARLYLTLLATEPEEALVAEFLAAGHAPDRVVVIDDVVYIAADARYSEVKANNGFIERKLKVAATTRVYATIARLVQMATSLDDSRRSEAATSDAAG